MTPDDLTAMIATKLRVPVAEVSRKADLIEDLAADSLALAELMAVVEEESGQRISMDVLQQVSTVGDLQDLMFQSNAADD